LSPSEVIQSKAKAGRALNAATGASARLNACRSLRLDSYEFFLFLLLFTRGQTLELFPVLIQVQTLEHKEAEIL
jgi:hypothetical protein